MSSRPAARRQADNWWLPPLWLLAQPATSRCSSSHSRPKRLELSPQRSPFRTWPVHKRQPSTERRVDSSFRHRLASHPRKPVTEPTKTSIDTNQAVRFTANWQPMKAEHPNQGVRPSKDEEERDDPQHHSESAQPKFNRSDDAAGGDSRRWHSGLTASRSDFYSDPVECSGAEACRGVNSVSKSTRPAPDSSPRVLRICMGNRRPQHQSRGVGDNPSVQLPRCRSGKGQAPERQDTQPLPGEPAERDQAGSPYHGESRAVTPGPPCDRSWKDLLDGFLEQRPAG